MMAIQYGHHEVVHTLLEYGVDVNAKSNVRNQMMMMIMIIVLTMMMMMMVVDNDDSVDNRY